MVCLHKIKCEFLLPTARDVRVFGFFFAKVVLLKVVHPLEHTAFHGPTLCGETFVSTSEV
jgi:hypothetical protein